MSPQTTHSHPSPITALLHENPDAMRMTSRRSPPSRRGFWALLLCAAVLNIGVIALGVYLFGFASKTVAPPRDRKIAVPFADEVALWDSLRAWVVQEDGRNKPFDTFCRETVRTITGRERFEGNDPIAVVASWILLHDPDENNAWRNGKKMDCEWDEYPFILSDHHELRSLLFPEKRGADIALTEEELHGKYVSPKLLRDSTAFKNLLRDSAARQEQDSKAPQTQLEQKASEVKKRLALYERVRSGGQEALERVHAPGAMGIVSLDRRSSTWFSLRALGEFQKDPQRWDDMMRNRRVMSPREYQGSAVQKFPADEVKRVTSAASAMQTAYLSNDVDAFAALAAKFTETIEDVSLRFNDYPATATTEL